MIAEAFADPMVNAVCARSNVVRGESIIHQGSGTDVYIDNLAKTIGWARIDQPETFFRRSAYEKVGRLNENCIILWTRSGGFDICLFSA